MYTSAIEMLAALCCGAALAADFDIRDYGAVADGKTMNSAAIEAAVQACVDAGGGRVVVDGGTFLSGPIRLYGGIELHVAKGSTLLASPHLKDFPEWRDVRHIVHPEALPRRRNASFIFADEAVGLKITGDGVIDGNGENFVRRKSNPNWFGWEFERCVGPTESLPRLVFLVGCSNVVVRGITIAHPPAGWSTWFHDCDNLLVEGVKVKADVRYPNNDGIHVNSCRDVVVRNCDLETGDDAIVVRANNRSLADNKVCERVTISNCTVRSWASGIRIGWTNDGVIRNCRFRDIRMRDCSNGVSLALPRVGGWNAYDYGREPTRFEDILFEDIAMDGIYGRPIYGFVESAALGTLCDGFHGVRFRNVTACCLEGPLFVGRADAVVRISLCNCKFIRVPESTLPNFRRHGAAAWDRMPGRKSRHYEVLEEE